MLDRFRTFATALAVTGLFAAAPVAAEDAPNADTVVATVNGTDITLGHMLVLRAGLPQQFAQLPADVLFSGILDQLISQTLLMDAKEGDLSKRAILTLENERRALVATDEMTRIVADAITDETVTAAFEETYADGTETTEYKASHILVETEEKAQELIGLLENGADFAALAQEHSTGPSGPSGGTLGWFSAGMMVQPFQDAVEKMSAGDVSPPVQTQFGWHVILLEETRVKDQPKLEDVRGDIENKLSQQAIDAEIARLTKLGGVDRAAGDAMDPSVLDQTDLLEE
ncbi:peptidylprolyl isomerase [Rhodobacteraceae bacterium KMM 6894]|nr:peptidylprolyl isomerase [Rhodobacteraceae bacterium KMM 6894]